MISLIILLLLWHALADFPLQGDFIARFKAPAIYWPERAPAPNGDYGWVPNAIWPWCMSAHCMIHAGGVFFITMSWQCAVFEFATHWVIDWTKCHGRISFNTDQVLHLIGKLVIILSLVL